MAVGREVHDKRSHWSLLITRPAQGRGKLGQFAPGPQLERGPLIILLVYFVENR